MRWLLLLCVLVCACVMYLALVEPVTPYEPSPKTQDWTIATASPTFFLRHDPDIWSPSTWLHMAPIRMGVVSASVVPARLAFTDTVSLADDFQLSKHQLNVSGSVFTVDVRREVDGVLYWSVNGMAKRLWKMEARLQELEKVKKTLCSMVSKIAFARGWETTDTYFALWRACK